VSYRIVRSNAKATEKTDNDNLFRASTPTEEMTGSPALALASSFVTYRRSIAERGGCFERRLFVNLFVCQHDNFRTIERRMMKLGD